MSSEKKFRIQNGLDVAGEVFVNGINIVGADGVLNEASYQTAVQAMIDATVAQGVDQGSIGQAVDKAVSDLADAAPATLDTLNELAAALGDDANFATSMTNALNTKLNSANNLSDVADPAAARSNLGLGTAATAATTSFATAAQGAKADAAATASDLTALETQISSGVATLAQGAKADTAVQPEDFFTVADGTTTSYVADWSNTVWGNIRTFSGDHIVDMQISNDGHVVTVHADGGDWPGSGYVPEDHPISYKVRVTDPSGNVLTNKSMGSYTFSGTYLRGNDGARLVSADITDTHLFILSNYGTYGGYSVYSLNDIDTPIGGIRQHSQIGSAITSYQRALIRHCGEDDKLLIGSRGTQYNQGAVGVKWETEASWGTGVNSSDSGDISVNPESGWIYVAYRSGVVSGYNHITNESAPNLTGKACAVGSKYVVVSDYQGYSTPVSVYEVGTSNLVASLNAPSGIQAWGGWAYSKNDLATNGDVVIVTGRNSNATGYVYDMASSSPTTIVKQFYVSTGASNNMSPPYIEVSANSEVLQFGFTSATITQGPVDAIVTPNVDASTLASKVYVDNAVANADPDLSSYPNTTEMTTAIATAKTEAQTYADGAVADAIDAAPAGLDTLNELAAALNDDANFASTVTTSLATKAEAAEVLTLQNSLDISGKLTVQSTAPTVGNIYDVWISSMTGVVHKAKPSGIVEATLGTWTGTNLSGVPRAGSNRIQFGSGYINQSSSRYGVLFTNVVGMSIHNKTDYYVHKANGAAYVEWVDPIYIQYWNEEGETQDTYLEWVLYEDGSQVQYGGNSPTRGKVTINTARRVKGMTFNTVSNLNQGSLKVMTIKAVLPQSGTWEETGQIDLSPYSTTAEMNSAIATAVANADVDLSGYSTTAEMNTAISNVSVDLSGYSTTAEMNTAITAEVAATVDAAPAALDTLNELAAALGDDANFASTMTTALAGKASTSDLATKADVSETGLVGELIVPSTETSISYQGEVEGPTYVARLSETSAGNVSVYNINDMETSLFDAQMFPWGAAESISWITSKYTDSTILPSQTSTSGTYAVGVYRTDQETRSNPSGVLNASSNSFIRRLRITDLVKGAQGNGNGSFVDIRTPKAMARALPGYSYESGNANLVVSGSLVDDAWRSQGENSFAWKVMSGEDGMWVGDKDKSSLYYYHQTSIYPHGNDTWPHDNYGVEFQYQGMYRSPTEALHKTSNMGYRVTTIGQYTDTNETPFSSMNNFAHNFTTIGRCAIIMSNDGSKKLWVHNPHATPGITASVSFDGPSDATSDFGTSMVSSPDNKWLLIGDGVSVWFYDVSNIDWSSKDSTSVPSIAPVKISKETFEDENGENAFAPLGANAAKNGFAAMTNVKGGKGSLFLTNTEAFVGTEDYIIRFDLTDLTKTPDQLSVPNGHTVTDIMVSDNVIHIQTDAPSNDSSKAIMSKDLTDIQITGAAIYGSWTDAHTDGLYNSHSLLQVSSDVDLYSNTTIGLNMSIPVTSIGTVTESIVPSSSLTKAINYLENKSVDLSGYSTTAEMNTAIANADIAISSSDLDMNGNKVLFANVYSTLSDLPSASTYHGMFAHVHGTGKAYYAHAGNWVELADASSLVTQSDIDTAIAAIPSTDLTPYSTTAEMNTAIAAIPSTDLTPYSTTAEMNSAITAEVANVVDAAPAALDTLNELAAALGDDANFASTVTTSLADKASQVDLDAETTRATSAETINNQAIAILQNQVSGISTSSGSTDIEMQANVDMATNKISNLGTPTSGTDAATKAYVDSASSTETAARIAGDAANSAEVAAAIATASADATAKADSAEADAKAYADQVVAATVDAAPAALDTLNELAAALGDDANFASTVTASIATKADDAATTAALATKANDAVTTAALATKEDKTVVAALDSFVKGSSSSSNVDNIDSGEMWFGNGTGPGHPGNQGGTVIVEASGMSPLRSGYTGSGMRLQPEKVNFTEELTEPGEYTFTFTGPSNANGNIRIVAMAGWFDWHSATNGTWWTGSEFVEGYTVDSTYTHNASNYASGSYTFTVPADGAVLVLYHDAPDGSSLYLSDLSLVKTVAAPTLETTSTTIVEGINELHTELNALSGTDTTLTASITANASAIAAETAARTSAVTSAISTASADATTKANAAQAAAAVDATTKADQAETDAKAYADQVVAATVDAAPAALDTLNELAAALGDDANFASTVTTSLAAKADDVATTAALATKADASAMTTALAAKADASSVSSIEDFLNGNAGDGAPTVESTITNPTGNTDWGDEFIVHDDVVLVRSNTSLYLYSPNDLVNHIGNFGMSRQHNFAYDPVTKILATGHHNAGGNNSGYVNFFHLSEVIAGTGDYKLSQFVSIDTGATRDPNLGHSIAFADGKFYASKFSDNYGATPAVYVWNASDIDAQSSSITVGNPVTVVTPTIISAPSAADPRGYWGREIAAAGNYLYVEDWFYSQVDTNAGAIFIFNTSDNQLVTTLECSNDVKYFVEATENYYAVHWHGASPTKTRVYQAGTNTLVAELYSVTQRDHNLHEFGNNLALGWVEHPYDANGNYIGGDKGVVIYDTSDFSKEPTYITTGSENYTVSSAQKLYAHTGGDVQVYDVSSLGGFSLQDDLEALITANTSAISTETSARQAAIVTAKSEAVALAASDATTKSDAAQAAAISTASADATTKANAAQAAAAVDATTKADQAEADAKAYADQVVASTVDAAPDALNTLNELAAALGDDANFASSVTSSIATKADDAATTTALATKADDVATTAALATKADDAATTAALATKATVTDVDAINTLLGKTEVAYYESMYSARDLGGSSSSSHSASQIGFDGGTSADTLRTSIHSQISSVSGVRRVEFLNNGTVTYGFVSPNDITSTTQYNSSMVRGELVLRTNGSNVGTGDPDAIHTNVYGTQYSTSVPSSQQNGSGVVSPASGHWPSFDTVKVYDSSGVQSEVTYSEYLTGNGFDSTGQPAGSVSFDTSSSTVSGAINELHTEIATLSGTDTTLTASITANTAAITAETSARTTADSTLQSSIDSEVARATAAEGVLTTAVSDETSARTSADTTLQSNIDTVSGRVDTILNGSSTSLDTIVEVVSAFENADSDLQTLISSNAGSHATNATAISTETTRATTAEGALQNAIDTEESARAQAISSEETARITFDASLQDQINALDTQETTSKSSLQLSIDNEVTRATTAEGVNAAAISAETTARTTAISAETTARESAVTSAISTASSDATTKADAAEADAIATASADATSKANAAQSAAVSTASADATAKANAAQSAAEATASADATTKADAAQAAAAADATTKSDAALVSAQTYADNAASTAVANVIDAAPASLDTLNELAAALGDDANFASTVTTSLATKANTADVATAAQGVKADSALQPGDAVSLTVDNSDKLDGQQSSHFRIDIYDINGNIVN